MVSKLSAKTKQPYANNNRLDVNSLSICNTFDDRNRQSNISCCGERRLKINHPTLFVRLQSGPVKSSTKHDVPIGCAASAGNPSKQSLEYCSYRGAGLCMHVVAFSQLSGISLANSLWLSSLGRAWRSNNRSYGLGLGLTFRERWGLERARTRDHAMLSMTVLWTRARVWPCFCGRLCLQKSGSGR